MSVSSQSDATPAYRGYRLQALYTLSRLLESNDSANFTFQPEGEEDLAIFDANHNLVEVVQVKAHSEDLAISSFKPDKSDSFFYRVAKLYLVAAIEALKALHERVLPTSDFQGQVSMDLEGMVEWANRLETGKQYAFLAYLFWASDIVSMTPFPK